MEKDLIEQERTKEAVDLAGDLRDFVNRSGHRKDIFIEQIVGRTHRTLQQNLGRLIFALIRAWGKEYENGRYDMRNEALVKSCMDIKDLMDNVHEGWDNLPSI